MLALPLRYHIYPRIASSIARDYPRSTGVPTKCLTTGDLSTDGAHLVDLSYEAFYAARMQALETALAGSQSSYLENVSRSLEVSLIDPVTGEHRVWQPEVDDSKLKRRPR